MKPSQVYTQLAPPGGYFINHDFPSVHVEELKKMEEDALLQKEFEKEQELDNNIRTMMADWTENGICDGPD